MGAKINHNFSEKQQIAMKCIVLVSKYHKRGMPFRKLKELGVVQMWRTFYLLLISFGA